MTDSIKPLIARIADLERRLNGAPTAPAPTRLPLGEGRASERAMSSAFRQFLETATRRQDGIRTPEKGLDASSNAQNAKPYADPSAQIRGLPYSGLISMAARRYGLDPALLAAVIRAESGFNPGAVSPVGAQGLMQLMEGTARSLGVRDSFDPGDNVDGGARFLRSLLDRYQGDTPLALAAYNAGPAAVDLHQGIPPFSETLAYVPQVLAYWRNYRALVGNPESPDGNGPQAA